MACHTSLVAEQLVHVLALWFNLQKVCPITTLHIADNLNSMTDISSQSFGSEPKWHFKLDNDLPTFFNCTFTLPNQNSWTACQSTSMRSMGVISVLRMTSFTLDYWRQLPAAGKHIGITGESMCCLWKWTLTFRIPTSPRRSNSCLDLQHKSAQATMVTETKPKIAQSLACLLPLARQS